MPMIDADVFRRARKGSIRAAISVMGDCYPQVYRLAYGLSGRDDVGRGVVRFVMKRGIRQLHTWSDESAPARWCQHHTLLTVRRAARHQPDVAQDTLVRGAQTDNAYYAAFIRALRSLPMQQREAFILTHGEQFELRNLATAMDCSQDAAQIHLKEATRALSALGGNFYSTFTAQMAQTYKSLTPSEELVLTNVQTGVKRYLWPRKIWRLIELIIMATVIAALVLFVWKIYPKLVY
jgi:DNA-directed RNA polymerase specialized sigma24 family protein